MISAVSVCPPQEEQGLLHRALLLRTPENLVSKNMVW